MSFDGFVNRCLIKELNEKILGSKIDKIYQPEKHEIILNLRTISGMYKLLISASNTNPRFNLTNVKKDNPLVAPLFCMIFRKHFQSGKIKAIHQNNYDRTTVIEVETYTELGDLTVNKIIIEIMGKHSNIILTSEKNIIFDSIKHIDFTVSSVRQILPGLKYEFPPKQDKLLPEEVTEEKLSNLFSDTNSKSDILDLSAEKNILMTNIMGLSPLLADEILLIESQNIKNKIIANTIELLDNVKNHIYTPTLVYDSDNKHPIAFSCYDLKQYYPLKKFFSDSISEIIDKFFEERSLLEKLSQKTSSIVKTLNNNIDRCNKKISIHKTNLLKAEKRDKYKLYADLITANIYKIKTGDSCLITENFYSEKLENIEIPLDKELSPSSNAQKYYKLFNKLKAAEKFSKEELVKAESEIYYLETVLNSIYSAKTVEDIDDIKDELSEQGYIRTIKKKSKNPIKKLNPLHFKTTDGYDVLVGRNNKENDILTLKDSYSTDIWLHTKSIPGSHTIIKTNGNSVVPENTIIEAAKIAAFYSKGKISSQVPIDYTEVKNVKKPNGAKPGFVIYDIYNTVFVTPSEDLIEKLKEK